MKCLTILILTYFLLLPRERNDYISIEYMGSADKPIAVIFISTKLIPDSLQTATVDSENLINDYIVYNNEFAFIKNAINSTPRELFRIKEYHGAKITVYKKNTAVSYLINRRNYNVLYLKISNYLKSHNRNKALIRHLALLRKENIR